MDKKIGVSILFGFFLFVGLFGFVKIAQSELDTTANTNIAIYGGSLLGNDTQALGGGIDIVNVTVAVVNTNSPDNITNITIHMQGEGNYSFINFVDENDESVHALNESDTVTNITLWGGNGEVSGWECWNLSLYIITCNGSAENVLDPNAASANNSVVVRFNVTVASGTEDKEIWNITTNDGTNDNSTTLETFIDGVAPTFFDVNLTDGNVTRLNGSSLNYSNFVFSGTDLIVYATVLESNPGTFWLVYNTSTDGIEPMVSATDAAPTGGILEAVKAGDAHQQGGVEDSISNRFTTANLYKWTIPGSELVSSTNVTFQFWSNDTFNQELVFNDSQNGWGNQAAGSEDEPFQIGTNESILHVTNFNITVNDVTLTAPLTPTDYLPQGNATIEIEISGYNIGSPFMSLHYNETGPIIVRNDGVIENLATDSIAVFDGVADTDANVTSVDASTNEWIKDGVFRASIDLSNKNNETKNFNFVVMINATAPENSRNHSSHNNTVIFGPYQIALDGSTPVPTIAAPATTTVGISDTTGISYTCNSDETGISNYKWTLTKPTETLTFSDTSADITFSGSNIDTAGTYNLVCQTTDTVGNTADSASSSFDVTFATTSGSSGGSGGSGTTTAAVSFDVDFSKDSAGTIKAQQGRIKSFSFDGSTKHTVTFDKVTATSATVTIASTPVTVTLNTGQSKEVDINGDGVSDMSVMLKSVVNGVADLAISKIEAGAQIVAREEKEAAGVPDSGTGDVAADRGDSTATPVQRSNTGLIVTLLIIVALVIVGYFAYKRK